jgi:glycosyltransferase A (GT-A) superfamily protein (DUF2064 family)
MNVNHKKTALLVFSLSAKKESHRKHIFGKQNAAENTVFFDALIRQTQTLAAKSNIDVVWVGEQQQVGNTFTVRYANAYQNLFDKGYQKVISIGNDCPDLTSEVLETAIQQLNNRDIVAGPAKDGGIYLLGLDKKAFNKKEFLELPWQTAKLYQEIKENSAAKNTTIFSLGYLADIDSARDAQTYQKERPYTFIGLLIKKIFSQLHFISVQFTIEAFHQTSILSFGLRAPPSV